MPMETALGFWSPLEENFREFHNIRIWCKNTTLPTILKGKRVLELEERNRSLDTHSQGECDSSHDLQILGEF
jgi:hypothetical protein